MGLGLPICDELVKSNVFSRLPKHARISAALVSDEWSRAMRMVTVPVLQHGLYSLPAPACNSSQNNLLINMSCNGKLVMVHCKDSGVNYITNITDKLLTWTQIPSMKDAEHCAAIELFGNTIYLLMADSTLQAYNFLEKQWRFIEVDNKGIVNIFADKNGLIGVFVTGIARNYSLELKRYYHQTREWSHPFATFKEDGVIMPILSSIGGELVMVRWIFGDTSIYRLNQLDGTWEAFDGILVAHGQGACIGLQCTEDNSAFVIFPRSIWKCTLEWKKDKVEWKRLDEDCCWVEDCVEWYEKNKRKNIVFKTRLAMNKTFKRTEIL